MTWIFNKTNYTWDTPFDSLEISFHYCLWAKKQELGQVIDLNLVPTLFVQCKFPEQHSAARFGVYAELENAIKMDLESISPGIIWMICLLFVSPVFSSRLHICRRPCATCNLQYILFSFHQIRTGQQKKYQTLQRLQGITNKLPCI